MSVTIEFDGRYRNKIKNVSPREIVLEGRSLSVRGIRIPVQEDRLYDLFYFLQGITRYQVGKITIVLLGDGVMKYTGRATDNKADYYADKILGFGTVQSYHVIYRRINEIPSHDVYIRGTMEDYY
jgi:hypothetical protein